MMNKVKTGAQSRRQFLRQLSAVGTVAALAGAGRALGAPLRREHPNVLLIMTDDQGAWDVNCYGSKDLITPNLDALAARGVRFRQFYVGSSVCSPSRACLLTGCYPQRAGLPANAGTRGLPAANVTIAEMLKTAGYRTGLFGKWHLGESEGERPNDQGFDEFLGHLGGCIDNYSHFFYWSGPNRHDLWKGAVEHVEPGVFFPDIIVREACRFMEANREHPFFLYLPFNTPHYPLQAERRFVSMYADMKDENRRRYAAFVTSMDEKIGRILEKLDSLGLTDSTLVVFLSDNGHSEEVRAFGGGGSAGPYRGHKFTLWEGGLRLPGMVSWPGRIPQGAVRDQVVHAMDWLPTIADYCGVTPPERTIDGVTIRPVIERADAPSPHDALHWQLGQCWAVRQGNWKLVKDGDTLHVSDLASDPGESTNLAAAHPDVVARLTALHDAWVRAMASGSEKRVFDLKPGQQLPRAECPRVAARPFRIEAALRHNGGDGVIVAQGGTSVGYALYVRENRLRMTLRPGGRPVTVTAPKPLPDGDITVTGELTAETELIIAVDHTPVATANVGRFIHHMPDEPLAIGRDTDAPVGDYPEEKNAYPHTIESVRIELGPTP